MCIKFLGQKLKLYLAPEVEKEDVESRGSAGPSGWLFTKCERGPFSIVACSFSAPTECLSTVTRLSVVIRPCFPQFVGLRSQQARKLRKLRILLYLFDYFSLFTLPSG